MHGTNAGRCGQRDVVGIELNHVGRYQPLPIEAQVAGVPHRALVEVLGNVGGFGGRLCQVHGDYRVELRCLLHGSAQVLRGYRVGCMRREGGGNARVATFPAGHEINRSGEGIVPAAESRAGVIDVGRGDNGAQAAAIDHAGNLVGVEVHIDEAGGAAPNHFPAGQLGANPDEFGGDEAPLHGKNILVQPGHEVEVIHHAPEQGHGGVGVTVDQPGHEHAVVARNGARADKLPVDRRPRPHRRNGVAANDYGTVLDHLLALDHGEHIVAVDDDVAGHGIERHRIQQ